MRKIMNLCKVKSLAELDFSYNKHNDFFLLIHYSLDCMRAGNYQSVYKEIRKFKTIYSSAASTSKKQYINMDIYNDDMNIFQKVNIQNTEVKNCAIITYWGGFKAYDVFHEYEKICIPTFSYKDINNIVSIFYSQKNLLSLRNTNESYYRYIACLDKKTCKICGKLDRQVFKVSEIIPGVNYPPIHPGCRCVTGIFLPERDYSSLKRIAKNPLTNKWYYISANTSWLEWRNTFPEYAFKYDIPQSQNALSPEDAEIRSRLIITLDNDLLNYLKKNQGILQTEVYNHFHSSIKPDISERLYFWDKDGTIERIKHGRTYEIYS